VVAPVLTPLTFQYQDTGFLLNSDSVGFPFIDVSEVDGLDNAPYRVSQHDHEGTDGGFTDAEFETQRTITISGVLYCVPTAVEATLDTLKANFAPQRSPLPFYFLPDSSVSQRVIFAKCLGIRYNWEQVRRTGSTNIQIQLVAEDPTIYDSSLLSASVGLPGSGGSGRGFPKSYPMSYGGASTSNAVTVTNAGNRPADATFIIPGPVTNPGIISDTTGGGLFFSLVVNSGSNLVVNLRNRTVTLDGANRRSALRDPAGWFMLVPGANTIRYTANAFTASQMTVQWRNAWR
jgi:hypothetical protein